MCSVYLRFIELIESKPAKNKTKSVLSTRPRVSINKISGPLRCWLGVAKRPVAVTPSPAKLNEQNFTELRPRSQRPSLPSNDSDDMRPLLGEIKLLNAICDTGALVCQVPQIKTELVNVKHKPSS